MPATNLALELTSLVGRDHEIEELQRLVRGGARFVTLTGPGGSGKTRLAREAARSLAADFPDGTFLVSLAPIRDPDYIAHVIAQTLEVRETGSDPVLQRLKNFLEKRRLLLLLDNFEQILDAGPLVANLLSSCPQLQVLVTSRSALRVSGEREFPVPPLAIPDPHYLPADEDLLRYASVGLFIDRARAANPNMQADSGALRDIATICARLDGLPLAIELAAARTKLLTPAAMLARFEAGLPILTGGARDLPERQRTLHGAIAWSYDLLDPVEQALFRRLSVFSGGCNLDSAEAVCTEPGPSGEPVVDVLETIASLLDKNLVTQAKGIGPQPRFGMLETIREFGLEALGACGEVESIWQRHARHFLALAEEAGENIPGPAQESWLQRLEQEHDNLRATLRRQISHGDTQNAMRLAAALEQFWQFRGYVVEGRGWLETVLAADSASATPLRAKALTGLGMLQLYQNHYDAAQHSHEQALQIYQAANDAWNVALAINDLGTVALYRSDYPAARRRFEESLALRERLGDRRGSAVCLTNLGIVAQVQGRLGEARRLHERSMEVRRELDDSAGVARSLTRLGAVATEQRDYSGAQEFLRKALRLSRDEGDDRAAASSLSTLGTVALELGNVSEAQALLEEGLAIRRRVGDRSGMLRSLWHLRRIAEDSGDLDRARLLWEEGLPMQDEAADLRGMALWRAGLADLLVRQGDYASARAHYERSLLLRGQIGDQAGAAVILGRLAQISLQDGDVIRARRQLEESVEALRELDDTQALRAALTNLAQIVAGQNDLPTAERLYREALALHGDGSSLQVVLLCLSGLAAAALARGDSHVTGVLCGAAHSILDTLGGLDSEHAGDVHHVSDPLALDRSDPDIAEAWALGEGMSLQEAVEFALAEVAPSDKSDAGNHYPDGLSEREVEVLRLMACGKSNPEIAAELYISVNTVYRHVSHIFAKTGASNRVEASSYAERRGLTAAPTITDS